MTREEILDALNNHLHVTHPKRDGVYQLGFLVKMKVNGLWEEGLCYWENKPGRNPFYVRALEDFQKFEVVRHG